MIDGQRRHSHIVLNGLIENINNRQGLGDIGHQGALGQHYAFGGTGGATGVLQGADIV